MNCMSCGTSLPDDARFCAVCGQPVSAVAQQPGAGGFKIDDDGRGTGRGYQYEILHRPAFSLAIVKLGAGQSIQAEAGAMVSMSVSYTHLTLPTSDLV